MGTGVSKCSCLWLGLWGIQCECFSGAMPSHSLQVALSVSLRAHECWEALQWLGTQESLVRMWTTGDPSLTISPHWRASLGSQLMLANQAALLLSPSLPYYFLSLLYWSPVLSLRLSTWNAIIYSQFCGGHKYQMPIVSHVKTIKIILFLFNCWIIFHCTDVLQFIHSPTKGHLDFL